MIPRIEANAISPHTERVGTFLGCNSLKTKYVGAFRPPLFAETNASMKAPVAPLYRRTSEVSPLITLQYLLGAYIIN